MGHIEQAKDNLVPLIDRLNKYPIGLVDNEKLRKILMFLFSEREAFVASKFPLEEATLPELLRRTRMDEDELMPILNNLADKGIIMDLPYGRTTYYLLLPGLIGFFEFTFMKNRTDLPMAELATLMREYLYDDPATGQYSEFFGSATPLTRALIYDDQIPVTSVATTTETAKNIIRNSSFGAVTMRYCRHKQQHEGKQCKKGAPVEGICISLGTGSKFMVRRGFAERKTQAELLEIIDQADALNLTHITDNIRQRPSFICNCCGCCCELAHGVQVGYHEGIGKTDYIAVIEPAKCDYCADCFKACNVNSIGLARNVAFESKDDRYSAIRDEICLGCGACISACEKEAITMVSRGTVRDMPEKKRDLFMQMLKEKGRLTPFVMGRMGKLARKYIPGMHYILR